MTLAQGEVGERDDTGQGGERAGRHTTAGAQQKCGVHPKKSSGSRLSGTWKKL